MNKESGMTIGQALRFEHNQSMGWIMCRFGIDETVKDPTPKELSAPKTIQIGNEEKRK